MIRFDRETWNEDIRYDYPLNEDSVVFDLGAYTGYFTETIHAKYKCNVFAFEPIFEYFKDLTNKFKDNPKITILNFGISNAMKEGRITVDGQSSSAFNCCVDNFTNVNFIPLGVAMQKTGTKTIDLLKINIEGGEYEVLEDLLDSGNIKYIRFIQVQFHEFESYLPSRLKNIRERLEESHSCTWRWEPMVWESWEAVS